MDTVDELEVIDCTQERAFSVSFYLFSVTELPFTERKVINIPFL